MGRGTLKSLEKIFSGYSLHTAKVTGSSPVAPTTCPVGFSSNYIVNSTISKDYPRLLFISLARIRRVKNSIFSKKRCEKGVKAWGSVWGE